MTRKTIIQTLNENAIADKYLYKLLRKIQYKYGSELLGGNNVSLTDKEFLDVLRFADILSRSEISLNKNR